MAFSRSANQLRMPTELVRDSARTGAPRAPHVFPLGSFSLERVLSPDAPTMAGPPQSVTSTPLLLATTPASTTAVLSYLARTPRATIPQGDLRYLHTVRSGSLRRTAPSVAGSHDAFMYYRQLSASVMTVTEWARAHSFDAALLAPSTRHDAEPYFAAAFHVQRDCEDLSRFFEKASGLRTGSLSLSEVLAGISCSLGSAARFRHVLIVDDVVSDARTVTALTQRLLERGLSPAAGVTILAALRMDGS